MPTPGFDYDVISQPAMPPPPPAQPGGLAKSTDPRHNEARGEPR